MGHLWSPGFAGSIDPHRVAVTAGFLVHQARPNHHGRTVTFRGQLRTAGVAGQAGLHLAVGAVVEPPGAHLRDRGGGSLAAPGSSDWTWHEVTMPVPDVGVIRFGISLTSRGRIELRNAELTPARPETRQQR